MTLIKFKICSTCKSSCKIRQVLIRRFLSMNDSKLPTQSLKLKTLLTLLGTSYNWKLEPFFHSSNSRSLWISGKDCFVCRSDRSWDYFSRRFFNLLFPFVFGLLERSFYFHAPAFSRDFLVGFQSLSLSVETCWKERLRYQIYTTYENKSGSTYRYFKKD